MLYKKQNRRTILFCLLHTVFYLTKGKRLIYPYGRVKRFLRLFGVESIRHTIYLFSLRILRGQDALIPLGIVNS